MCTKDVHALVTFWDGKEGGKIWDEDEGKRYQPGCALRNQDVHPFVTFWDG